MAGPAQRGAVLRGRGADRHGVRARSVGAHPARRRPRSAGLGIVRGGVPPLRQGRASQAGGCGCTDRRTRPTATLGGVPPMTVSRRNFLALSALGVAAVALPSCGRSEGIEQTAELLTSEGPLPKPFTVPLPVPAVKKPVRTDATTDYYEITQRVADVEILPGRRTPVFSYDGTFPGPTIRSRSGRRTVVTHRNKLDVPTVVHLHGGHTPPEHDGYPTDLVIPEGGRLADHVGHGGHPLGDVSKGSREYVYPLDQPAATLWYHDHRMDFTGPQVWYGLAGFHLVHDEVEDELPLPRDERDIPLMICDRAFDGDGRFRYPAIDQSLRHTPG